MRRLWVALDAVLGEIDDRWETCMVVSGDGDLARVGVVVKRFGKRFEVASCPRSLSADLADEADAVVRLRADLLGRFKRGT